MKRLKRISIWVISFQVIASMAPALVLADAAQAVTYLQNQSPSDWRTMALAAADRRADLEYLRGVPRGNARDKARQILAISAAGEDPRTFDGVDRVSELLDEARNNQIGDPELLNDDFWGVIALRSAGAASDHQAIQDSIAVIRSAQNINGGWAWNTSAAPDTDDTAAAIMALRAGGAAANDQDIEEALAWLRTTQQPDGGFPNMMAGDTVSNAASDSWVISALYSLGIDPEAWERNGHSPIDHLLSLQQPDGGFSWVANPAQSNPQITAYAVVAIEESFYPVATYQAQEPENPGRGQEIFFRIEGSANTICSGLIRAENALQAVETAAGQCGFTYVIQQLAFGPYLYQINNEAAEGMAGWMYRVNWLSPMVGAADYLLSEGDSVFWAYTEFGTEPLRLRTQPQSPRRGEEISITVEQYDSGTGQWSQARDARLFADGIEQPLPEGVATSRFEDLGIHTLKARKAGYIASGVTEIRIGEENAQAELVVVVEGGGRVGGEREVRPDVSVTVSAERVNFGSAAGGGMVSGGLSVQNTGTLPIYVEGVVTGDELFTRNLRVDGNAWDQFSATLARDARRDLQLSLVIPAETASGEKRGAFIVWAVRSE